MKSLWLNVQRFLNDEEGATAIECGLITALIAVTIILAVTDVGAQIGITFNTIADTLANAIASG